MRARQIKIAYWEAKRAIRFLAKMDGPATHRMLIGMLPLCESEFSRRWREIMLA